MSNAWRHHDIAHEVEADADSAFWALVDERAREIEKGDDADMSEIVCMASDYPETFGKRFWPAIRALINSYGSREAELEAAVGLRELLCQQAHTLAHERVTREIEQEKLL